MSQLARPGMHLRLLPRESPANRDLCVDDMEREVDNDIVEGWVTVYVKETSALAKAEKAIVNLATGCNGKLLVHYETACHSC